jgi:hypothetical protein
MDYEFLRLKQRLQFQYIAANSGRVGNNDESFGMVESIK